MGQELKEKTPPNHIGTIIFQADEQIENTPIVELGKAFTLRFDNLNADEAYYYYTIQHANADWTASELFKLSHVVSKVQIATCMYLFKNCVKNLQNSVHSLHNF